MFLNPSKIFVLSAAVSGQQAFVTFTLARFEQKRSETKIFRLRRVLRNNLSLTDTKIKNLL